MVTRRIIGSNMYYHSLYELHVDISMYCAAGVVGDIGLVVRHPTMHDVGNIEVLPATRCQNHLVQHQRNRQYHHDCLR